MTEHRCDTPPTGLPGDEWMCPVCEVWWWADEPDDDDGAAIIYWRSLADLP